MRLIDADALREELDSVLNWDTNNEYNMYSDTIDAIDNAPTIEAEPVRHGKWDENAVPFCNVCQECGAVVERHCVKRNGSLKRCPNCGAKMDGDPDV